MIESSDLIAQKLWEWLHIKHEPIEPEIEDILQERQQFVKHGFNWQNLDEEQLVGEHRGH